VHIPTGAAARHGAAIWREGFKVRDLSGVRHKDLPLWLEWVRYAGALVAPAWFIIVVTGLMWWVLGNDQTVEALQAIESNPNLRLGAAWAAGVYAFTAGYFAMALMSVAYPGNDPPDRIEADVDALRTVERASIMALVILITAAVPARLILVGRAHDMSYLVWDGALILCGLALLVAAAKLPGYVIERRAARRAPEGSESLTAAVSVALLPAILMAANWIFSPFDARTAAARNPRMARTIFVVAIAIFLASLALLVAFLLFPVALPQRFGMMAIVLWAAASWIAFSSIFLIYLPRRYGLPSLLAFAVIGGLAWLFSYWNNNHAPCPGCAGITGERPGFETFAKDWIDSRAALFQASSEAGEKIPVYVVAASGGGIRAAYWTAATLAAFEEQVPGFACHLLAISGISGGSLGASAFAAALADQEDYGCDPSDWPLPASRSDPAATTRTMLSQDFLSPLLAGMLFADGVQRLNPFPFWKLPDRAHAQERAWEAAWRSAAGTARFAEPFLDLWADRQVGASPVPPLFLNATIVETGHQITIAPVDVAETGSFSDTYDLLNRWRRNIPLSTAANMSARFPFVSPAATLEIPSEGRQLRLVDGGYFESSGAHVALQIARAFIVAAGEQADAFQIVPILIIDDPGRSDDDPVTPEALLRLPPPGAPSQRSWALSELTSPLIAALNTRSARGLNAEQALIRYIGADCTITAAPTGDPIALGWLLSEESIDTLNDAASNLFAAGDGSADTNNAALLLRGSDNGGAVMPVPECDGAAWR